MQEHMEDEILKDDDGNNHLTHWVEQTDLKSTHAQQGAFSFGKDFLLRGMGGKCTLAQPLQGQGVLIFLFIISSDGQVEREI